MDAIPLPLDGVLDLHAFRPSEIHELLPEWMLSCRAAGRLELRVVHGKGSGAQRARVIELLDRSPLVLRHANDEGGNWGARRVWLHPRAADEPRIRAILESCRHLVAALQAVAAAAPPDALLGAGAVRNALWHRLHGLPGEPEPTDLDVIWHDPGGEPAEAAVQARLEAALPGLRWEAVNQALHPDPAPSVLEALARWPETATAVGARWREGVRLVAPLGTDDLIAMVIRRNPASPEAVYKARLASKRWRQRFPHATVMR